MTDDYSDDQQPLDEQTIAAGLLAEMQGEIDRLNGERLRALADAENARKRAEKAVQDEKAYGASKFARDLLSVADNLRRAIDTSVQAAKDDPAVANLLTGVELTEKELLGALEKNGIKRLEPKGQKFDPNFHQAIAEVPNTGQPHGTVVDVVQAGYMIADRLLRAAMVVVAKGEPLRPADPTAQPGSAFDTKA
ncbi:Protein GrpE [Alphaproteobacteria bacterium SO-S41]|nr:Protein GrpE [Alphaproteobacteria bacterium SO-S41]